MRAVGNVLSVRKKEGKRTDMLMKIHQKGEVGYAIHAEESLRELVGINLSVFCCDIMILPLYEFGINEL